MAFSVGMHTRWFFSLSVQRIIIIFEPLQWFVEFRRNGNNTFTVPHTSTVNALARWLAGWTWHVRTFKVLRMKVNSFRRFFLVLLITVSFFLFHYKYMNWHCCVYALNAPRGNIDCNLWTKLKQRKKQNRTNRQHSWDYSVRFFLSFSWSLK